jgi:Flp pilus assembly pilin Flp
LLRNIVAEESGQTLTEYALLLSFIVLATVLLAAGYHGSMAGVTNKIDGELACASNVSR